MIKLQRIIILILSITLATAHIKTRLLLQHSLSDQPLPSTYCRQLYSDSENQNPVLSTCCDLPNPFNNNCVARTWAGGPCNRGCRRQWPSSVAHITAGVGGSGLPQRPQAVRGRRGRGVHAAMDETCACVPQASTCQPPNQLKFQVLQYLFDLFAKASGK